MSSLFLLVLRVVESVGKEGGRVEGRSHTASTQPHH